MPLSCVCVCIDKESPPLSLSRGNSRREELKTKPRLVRGRRLWVGSTNNMMPWGEVANTKLASAVSLTYVTTFAGPPFLRSNKQSEERRPDWNHPNQRHTHRRSAPTSPRSVEGLPSLLPPSPLPPPTMPKQNPSFPFASHRDLRTTKWDFGESRRRSRNVVSGAVSQHSCARIARHDVPPSFS